MLCLVVDDDPTIRTFVCAIAHGEGLETLEAESGDDAFRVLQMRGGAVDLMITDIQMPNGNALALARVVAEKFPAVRTILMSGYAEADDAFDFVEKPFSWAIMRAAVRRLLKLRARVA